MLIRFVGESDASVWVNPHQVASVEAGVVIGTTRITAGGRDIVVQGFRDDITKRIKRAKPGKAR